jgi:large conductance mechanosensitive channel
MNSLLKEFRDFAMKGNVVDMAVGIIIGVAFGKIVTSLVNDVIMPAVGLLLGKVDFKALAVEIGSAKIGYGLFIQSVTDFIIVAFCIFIIVKQMNRFKKPAPPPAPMGPTDEVKLLTEIRDALKVGQ